MDFTLLGACFAAFFCGGLIKGIAGMGLPLTAIAFMTQFIELSIAVPLLVIPILITNAIQAMNGGNFFRLLRQFWLLIFSACITTFLGVNILERVDPFYLLITLGCIVTIYALINLFAVRVIINSKHHNWLSPLTGTFAGIMSGMTGVIAIPTVLYLQALQLSKDLFVQASGIIFFIGGLCLLLALQLGGHFNPSNLSVSCLAMFPAVVGSYFGRKLRQFIPEERFRNIIFIFLVLTGLNLIRKAFS
ncbi:MAG: hypothetical protein CMM44_10320 [Rhodospirillaceae bacterium]|nr:hypothetical protein [Rhodospirillaceae bacterium]|tara:strand:+ start:4293 stop:5033 length:741 start_codon:yes stop_codon:yes gene_type:complete